MKKLRYFGLLLTCLFFLNGITRAQVISSASPDIYFINAKGEKLINHSGVDPIQIEVVFKDKTSAQAAARSLQVTVISETEQLGEVVDLKETALNSGIFRGSIAPNEAAANSTNKKLETRPGERITVVYSPDPQNTSNSSAYEMWYKGPDWSFVNTGMSHIILIPHYAQITIDGVKIQPGDFISVFYDKKDGDKTRQLNAGGMGLGIAPGGVKYTGNVTAIAVWGTQEGKNNGLAVGEVLKWKIWRARDGKVFDAEATYMTEIMDPSIVNTDTYVIDGISGILSLTAKSR
jgi:hypothetical protein